MPEHDDTRKRVRHPGVAGALGLRRDPRELTLPPVDPHPERATLMTEYARWVTQMMTDVAHSLGGVALQGALPVPVGFDRDGRELSPSVSKSAGRLLGYSLFETAGQAVTVHFHDTDSQLATDGEECWHEQVAANSVTKLVGLNVSFSHGLALEYVTSNGGEIRGIVLLSGVD